MRVRTFLVLGQNAATGKVTVRRAVSRYPSLEWNEAVLALELEIPDDTFEAPLFTVQVEKRAIRVAVEAEDVEEALA
jgi:hypothetical protein